MASVRALGVRLLSPLVFFCTWYRPTTLVSKWYPLLYLCPCTLEFSNIQNLIQNNFQRMHWPLINCYEGTSMIITNQKTETREFSRVYQPVCSPLINDHRAQNSCTCLTQLWAPRCLSSRDFYSYARRARIKFFNHLQKLLKLTKIRIWRWRSWLLETTTGDKESKQNNVNEIRLEFRALSSLIREEQSTLRDTKHQICIVLRSVVVSLH